MTIKQTINHTMRESFQGKTGYGKAKRILEVMDKLKDIDHGADFEFKELNSVVYKWQTKEAVL